MIDKILDYIDRTHIVKLFIAFVIFAMLTGWLTA